jgi:hypothetical protein
MLAGSGLVFESGAYDLTLLVIDKRIINTINIIVIDVLFRLLISMKFNIGIEFLKATIG